MVGSIGKRLGFVNNCDNQETIVIYFAVGKENLRVR